MKQELLEQIKEWCRQQDILEEMIEEAYRRIDELTEEDVA
jgi:hypothetical protein